MKWDEVRRKPAFRWLVSFILFVILGKVVIHSSWLAAEVFAIGFASAMTVLFAVLERSRRN